MDFKDFAERNRGAVYRKICEYVKVREPEGHYKIMRDYIDRQGKYRRPALLLLTAQLYGASVGDAMLPAAAMQLSEDWILMQDDWEDDSELRRGKPAAHKLYGAIHTVNASNTGHMAMWRMLKDYVVSAGPEKGGALYDKFYDMLQCTVEGQYRENQFIHYTKSLAHASEGMYYSIVDTKSGYYSIYGPLQLGALVGSGTATDLRNLMAIGRPAGVAFQIVDDILDMTADEKSFGKKRYGDLYEGKLTLMVLHAYRNAAHSERAKMDSIYAKERARKTEADIGFIVDTVEKYHGIQYARDVARKYGQTARTALKRYLPTMPDNEYRKIMQSAVEEAFIREK